MKNIYETPVIEIYALADDDILTGSFEGEDDNLEDE
jgi:hypothetical protein